MAFKLDVNKDLAILSFQGKKLLSLSISKKVPAEDVSSFVFKNGTFKTTRSHGKIIKATSIKQGWKISYIGRPGWRNWWLRFKPSSLIFPTREGEYISNVRKLLPYQTYKLSYPGTASSKCVLVFTQQGGGFLIGAKPSLNWAMLSLTRIEEKDFILNFLQQEENIYLFPFSQKWETAVRKFRNLFLSSQPKKAFHKILNQPRFFLQMGVRDFFGKSYLKGFSDLFPLIKLFREKLGEGNFVHLFGTNAAGFDRMFPDFSIDPKLGGKAGLRRLINKVHSLGLYASHHFTPRIADIHWIDKHPDYKEAVVTNYKGNPWVEFYKNNVYFVMDPNHEKWQNHCLKVIEYLKSIGFDYVQLDQIAYQRNLPTKEGGFGPGYQKLIDLTAKKGIKFWVEGVSDIYKLPSDCYFQILPRDRIEMWETGENRRGYPYGTPFTLFYRQLMPKIPVSYQIATEKYKSNIVGKRLEIAKKIKANIYELELGFVDKTYNLRLKKTLEEIKKFSKNARKK